MPACSSAIRFAAGLAAFGPAALSGETVAPVPLGQLQAHDPSTFLREGDRWWMFSTGRLLKHAWSADLRAWHPAGSVLEAPPPWAKAVAPGNERAHYWAPDVIRIGDRTLLFYSVSEFGRNTSAIALASIQGTAVEGAGWKDEGIVLQSGEGDPFNAIDPSLLLDDGRLWMAFGSFWKGLFLVELDPTNGRLLDASKAPIHLAYSREIEAPTLHRRGEYFYLFLNEGLCCRGVNSTYRILVGRSRTITGPYLDETGRDLREGGGTLVLGSEGRRIGPGHAGFLQDADGEWMSFHYYDGERNGTPTLGLVRIEWSSEGWPVVLP